MTRLRTRSPQGNLAYSPKPIKRGQNVSIIGALGFNGVVADYSLMGATDGLTFEAFISQKVVPKLWTGACVLINNCSVLSAWVRCICRFIHCLLIRL